MNLVCDEGVERSIISHLREQRHHVLYVAEFERGITDEAVLAKASEMAAPLVTNDKDFGELVFRQRLLTTGVILLRLAGLTNEAKANVVVSAIHEHSAELAGAFTVITRSRVRIRRLPLV